MKKNLNKNSYFYKYQQAIKAKKIKVGIEIELMFKFVGWIHKLSFINFDLKKGQKPIKFIQKHCRHSEGEVAGKLFKLSLWQKAWIEIVFGTINKKTAKRHFREVFLLVGRKNAKSELSAALCLYMMIGDNEPGAKVYCVATNKEQARVVFKFARAMVRQDSALSQLFKVRQVDIEYPSNNAEFRALASDADNLDGYNPSFVIVDELHAHKTRQVYDLMQTALGARRQPLQINITTAGTIRESIYDFTYDRALHILNGNYSLKNVPTFLPIIYKLSKESHWDKKEQWIKANPNLGKSKKVEYMNEQLAIAKLDQSFLSAFLTRHCNIPQISIDAYLTLEEIKKNNNLHNLKDFKGSYAFVGIDLGQTTDLTAVSIILEKSKNKELFVHARGFMCKKQLDKNQKSDKVPYDIWEKQNLIIRSGEGFVDYRDIITYLQNFEKKYDIKILHIGIDRYSAAGVMLLLQAEGFVVEKVAQGPLTFNKPMEKLKGKFLEGMINHNQNGLFEWNVANVIVVRDQNGNQRPDKKSASTQRIDLFTALLNAMVVREEQILKLEYLFDLENKKRQTK